MSTYQQERETEQIIGVVTGVVQKGADKWQAVVMPDGSQYTKNLWTKDANIVTWLSSQIGQRIAFLCNASHWTNNSGQPIRSLWIDQVGPPSPGSPALQGPPQQPMTGTMVHPEQALGQHVVVTPQVQAMGQPQDVKEQRIHRQTATKVAAILLSNLPSEERNMSTLLTLAERLVAYYNNGMAHAETVEDLIQRAMPQGVEMPTQPDPSYAAQAPLPYTGDEDIPF